VPNKTCPKCDDPQYQGRHVATTKQPSINTMERWSNDGVARATDGCRTEPDGRCEHGHQSWIMRLGYI
jgi:hypothetical protein